jgi:hypothetical protein
MGIQAPVVDAVSGQSPGTCHFVPAEQCSVFADSEAEALRFKWIESEKVGYDLGDVALGLWVQKHWNGYLRARWIEHLEGKRFWVELGNRDYGLLQRAFHDQPVLLDRILDRLKIGQENLHIIIWAQDWHIPMDEVRKILTALDINSKRMQHHFDLYAC